MGLKEQKVFRLSASFLCIMRQSNYSGESVMVEQAPKSNRNLIIGVVMAIVLCCCCLVSAVAGYYGYQAYVKAQQVVDQFDDL